MAATVTRLRVNLAILAAVVVIGTAGFVVTEGLSPLDAVYFCIVTVATVGYGDIHPTTGEGKILAILVIVAGVGTFVGVIANLFETWMERRERRSRHRKVYMLIGAFFSTAGTPLLRTFSRADPLIGVIRDGLMVTADWSAKDFARMKKTVSTHASGPSASGIDLENIHTFLGEKKDFLLRLMENPILLEDEAFTEVLHATFHLADELSYRDDLAALPQSDLDHLTGDLRRAYLAMMYQWLGYMEHLQATYPYLFSLAVRTNPFNPEASAIVE